MALGHDALCRVFWPYALFMSAICLGFGPTSRILALCAFYVSPMPCYISPMRFYFGPMPFHFGPVSNVLALRKAFILGTNRSRGGSSLTEDHLAFCDLPFPSAVSFFVLGHLSRFCF